MEGEEDEQRNYAHHHVMVVPYPAQGHINPMLNFSKRLAKSYGLEVTFATTVFIYNSMNNPEDIILDPSSSSSSSSSSVLQLATISDGFDQGDVDLAESGLALYHQRLESEGSKTLAELIRNSPHPIDCIIYDAFLPWALDVAKAFGIPGAAFFTQACTVNYLFYCVHHGLLKLPVSPSSFPIAVDGLQWLHLLDMPSYISTEDSYPVYRQMLLNEFRNVHEADFVLFNTVYELEKEMVDSMSKVCPLLTIGPTIPSLYSDKRIKGDNDYGMNMFKLEQYSSDCIINWLNTKPPRSVVYVSFGSWISLSANQMEELALGLKATNLNFLWTVRSSEVSKLPRKFAEETSEKGLIVNWSPQLEVLANEAAGCFVTHCGWNSTFEALMLGVPMVGMPQATDQPTDAKIIEDLWKIGVRVKVDHDDDHEEMIVRRQEIEFCIRAVMEGDRAMQMRMNAKKLADVALQAIADGGSSDINIRHFLSKLQLLTKSRT